MYLRVAIILCLFLEQASGQVTKYDQFEIKAGDLVWHATYASAGKTDSLRHAVVQMLKSKFYTFNVIRNEIGYNGELKHFKINCKRYGRTYLNTPRMYWEGEWTGKFIVEVTDHSYEVTVYALYFESMKKTSDYYRTEKVVKGRFVDAVTKNDRTMLLKRELNNLSLMNLSLRDEFSLTSATYMNE